MKAHLSAAATLICAVFTLVFAMGGDAWGAALLGFSAGGWFITFIDKVWP